MSIRLTCLLSSLCLGLAACGEVGTERHYINANLPSEEGSSPFSGAVRAGDTLYISGMLGLENGQVPEDPAQEARNMLDSIQSTLEDAGMSMDDLVHVTIYATNLEDYGAFNEVYRSYFSEAFPARAFVGAGSLLAGARFEMQSIAVRGSAGGEAEAQDEDGFFSFF